MKPILTAILLAPLLALHAADAAKAKPRILVIYADALEVRLHDNACKSK